MILSIFGMMKFVSPTDFVANKK
ncbi:hypothetical protein Bhyg_04749 [Pseudolycoriella hygida]|uniref:Uncharacterized protein n=1 Tax=Pseudolycoriella hygida TaxID=35572 RepID=A0A9Q0NG72_9DIPT|nr:hypothetical protein Bhyg_04749 [Pseudolycoriella hygida]